MLSSPSILPLTILPSPLIFSVTQEMKLTSSAGSDRAWVWSVQADFADEEAKAEQLAIRFKNVESELDMLQGEVGRGSG